MSVKQTIQQLEALQVIDLQILELRRSGDVYPIQLAQIEADIDSFRKKLDAERMRLADNEKGRRDKEAEIADERDKLKKWEARLGDQRTTREYQALAREIDIVAKHVVNLDLELKQMIADTSGIKSSVLDREAEVQRRQGETATERQALEGKLASIKSEFDALQTKRSKATEGIDPALLARYEMIRGKRNTGLAMIVGGICKGCNLKLPPQLQNIMRAGASIQHCPSCNRFVFTPEMIA